MSVVALKFFDLFRCSTTPFSPLSNVLLFIDLTKPTVITPLIPKQIAPVPVVKPRTYATRAESITPFITVQQRADQAAFQRRQKAMTREQLLSRYGL